MEWDGMGIQIHRAHETFIPSQLHTIIIILNCKSSKGSHPHNDSDVESAPTSSITKDTPQSRERLSSRAAFYFAAIGSSVGFGNVWRFPSLVYEYGGTAFLVPYILATLLITLPVLVLEISLGQYYETGDVDVFGGIHRTLRGVGLSSIVCGLMLVTYYSMLLCYLFG